MQDVTDAVLEFWFAGITDPVETEPQEFWFKSSPEIDHDIRLRFEDAFGRALDGAFDDIAEAADDYLAVVILLDQMPRNMYRGTPRAFSGDCAARLWAERAIEAGHDTAQPPPHRRMFFYLPFEHSEDIADQDRAVALFETLGDAEYLKYAVAHRDVIQRFGRFPHRNGILDRESAPEEVEYLKDPNAGF